MLGALLWSVVALGQPFLQIDYDQPDDAVELFIVCPPSTNDVYLLVSTNLIHWDAVIPKLDSFPDQTTTNAFFVVHPQGQFFFKTSSDSNSVDQIQTSAPLALFSAPAPTKQDYYFALGQYLTMLLEAEAHKGDPKYPPMPPLLPPKR